MRENTRIRAHMTWIGLAVLGCILFLAHILRVKEITMPIILADEFGSIANAAYLVGADWSNIISYVGYYSFGGSLFYLPIFAVAENTDHIYHAIVVCNALLICVYYLLVYLLLRRLYESSPKWLSAVLAFAAALYPSYICYAYTAMYETVLLVTFAAAAWTFASFCKTGRVGYLYGFTAALGYLLMVHMRTVGVIFSAILLLCILTWGKHIPKKHFFGSLAVLAVLCGVFLVVKEYFFENLWLDGVNFQTSADGSASTPNTMASQMGKLSLIFSWQGIKNLLKLALGQSFYFVSATLLMGSIFLYAVVKKTCTQIRQRKFWEKDPVFLMLLFVGLAFLAQLAISCITFVKIVRFDLLFYGRYTEYLSGIIFVLAFMQLKTGAVRAREAAVCLGIYLAHGLCIWGLVPRIAPYVSDPNQVSMTSLAQFLSGKYLNVMQVVLFSVCCGAVVLAAALLPPRIRTENRWLKHVKHGLPLVGTVFTAVVFFRNGTGFTDSYIVPLNQIHQNYSKIGDVILENLTDDHVEYYNDPENHTLENLVKFELLQYRLLDVPLLLCDYDQLAETDAEILITDNHVQPWEEGLFGRYDILSYRGEIVVWQKRESETLTIPATLFQTLCTDRTDWSRNAYTSNGTEGYLICGTPLTAAAGSYTVTFDVELLDTQKADVEKPLFTLDVYQNGRSLSQLDIYGADITSGDRVSIPLDIEVSEDDLPCEFRVNVARDVELTVYQVQVAEERTGVNS